MLSIKPHVLQSIWKKILLAARLPTAQSVPIGETVHGA